MITSGCILIASAALLAGCESRNPTAPDRGAGDEGNAPGKVPVKVVNRLFSKVDLMLAGETVGTLSRLDSVEVLISAKAGELLRWRMEPATNGSGGRYGETLSGHFVIPNLPGGTPRFEITNTIGRDKYFAILLGNSTSTDLMFGINMGLPDPDNQWESTCYCPLLPDSPLRYYGYYRLLESSSIRVYRFGSEYAGPYDMWLRFSDQVDDKSGIVILTVYAIPAGVPSGPAAAGKRIASPIRKVRSGSGIGSMPPGASCPPAPPPGRPGSP